jgi:hypothetical protein
MSREIIVAAWCDRCEAAERLKVPATHTYTIGLVRGESRPAPRVIELCDACDPALADVFDLVAKHSIPLDTANPTKPPEASSPAEFAECLVCGSTMTRGSIVGHVWSQHRPGETKPAQPARCPVCRGSYSAAGMPMHRARAHGDYALDEAYRGLV